LLPVSEPVSGDNLQPKVCEDSRKLNKSCEGTKTGTAPTLPLPSVLRSKKCNSQQPLLLSKMAGKSKLLQILNSNNTLLLCLCNRQV